MPLDTDVNMGQPGSVLLQGESYSPMPLQDDGISSSLLEESTVGTVGSLAGVSSRDFDPQDTDDLEVDDLDMDFGPSGEAARSAAAAAGESGDEDEDVRAAREAVWREMEREMHFPEPITGLSEAPATSTGSFITGTTALAGLGSKVPRGMKRPTLHSAVDNRRSEAAGESQSAPSRFSGPVDDLTIEEVLGYWAFPPMKTAPSHLALLTRTIPKSLNDASSLQPYEKMEIEHYNSMEGMWWDPKPDLQLESA
ncbi:hypothetical protein HK405_012919, partial [Cladochytrium tenue]